MGEAGPAMAGEIVGRMKLENPKLVSSLNELGKSLESIASKGVAPKNTSLLDISNMEAVDIERLFKPDTDEYLGTKKGGTWLRTGLKEAGDLYIPSGYEVKAIEPYLTPTDATMPGDLMRSYQRFTENAFATRTGKRSTFTFAQDVDALRTDIGKAQMQVLTAKGGLARSDLMGSRFLTGVGLKINPDNPDLQTSFIGETHATRVIDELAEAGEGLTGPERRAWMTGESSIPGMLARHPYVYQTSALPTNIKVMPGVEESVVRLPAAMVKFTTGTGSEAITHQLDLGPMALGGGDVDADPYVVTPMRKSKKEVSEFIKKHSETSFFKTDKLNALEAEAIRIQLLDKMVRPSNAAAATMAETLAGDAIKHTTAISEIGRLSMTMSEVRAAIIAAEGLTTKRAKSALTLASFMEQTPLSPKHLSTRDAMAGKLRAAFANTRRGTHERSERHLEALVADYARNADATTKQLLTGDVKGMINGKSVTVPGVPVRQAVGDIVASMRASDASIQNGISATRARNIIMGRQGKRIGHDDSLALLKQSRGTLKAFMSGATDAPKLGSKLSTSIISRINQAGATGSRLLQYAKPLAIGGAAAVTIASLMSAPEPTIGRLPPPPAQQLSLKTSNQYTSEQMKPPAGVVHGSPTTAPMHHQNSARMSSPQPRGARVSVSASNRQGVDIQRISNRMRPAIGSGNVNIQVRDNRSQLRPHHISDMLEG